MAELLRFQLYDCDADRIPVSKEIEYLKNYFTLQSIRKENCITEFLYDDVPAELTIAPLLIVPFIENAFKYVSDYDDRPNFIKAALKFGGDTLYFHCTNTMLPFHMPNGQANKGIGLNNVVKRLQLIYGDQYTLTNSINGDIYIVDLKIRLK